MKITAAQYKQDFLIALSFSDGSRLIADLWPFLIEAKNPMTTQFRDVEKFKTFELHNGYLTWSGQMDLEAAWLHEYAATQYEDALDSKAVESAKIKNDFTPWETVKKQLDKKHGIKN